MARRMITTHTCDMSGVESDEVRTHTFALDGKTWEIDLAPHEFQVFSVGHLGVYFDRARPLKANAKPQRQAPGYDAKAVRAWAQANGVPVSERGRIKAEVVEQWKAAAA